MNVTTFLTKWVLVFCLLADLLVYACLRYPWWACGLWAASLVGAVRYVRTN